MNDDFNYILKMKEYLVERKLLLDQSIGIAISQRESGRTFTYSEHLKGLVYSLLSNNRPWAGVVPHLTTIDDIFNNYNREYFISADKSEIESQIRSIKCGNRNIHKQIFNLKYNIGIFDNICHEYGNLDAFVTHKPAHEIVTMISSTKSRYKLKEIGTALAWEYLRNVGVDGCKPDIHLRRFFGKGRLNYSSKEMAEINITIEKVKQICTSQKLKEYEVDNIIWSFCSPDYGNMCGATPKCELCPIKNHCKC